MIIVLAAAALAVPYFLHPVSVDIAPLARLQLADGTDLNPRARPYERESPYALTDGLAYPDHQLVFPAGAASLRIEFPTAFQAHDLHVVAAPGGTAKSLRARLSAPGRPPASGVGDWRHTANLASHCRFGLTRAPAAAIDFDVGTNPPPWLVVNVLTSAPRGIAWLYAIVLTLVLPAAVALQFAFGVIGLGSSRRETESGVVLVWGLLAGTGVAVVWTLLPRSSVADALIALGWAAAAVRGLRLSVGRIPGRRLMALAAIFLVVQTEVESYALSDARVSPLDYLHAHYGARRLSRGLPIGAELSERPWLLHTLAAPWDRLLGRFGYWGYVGVVAGLNSLSLLAADSVLRRLGTGDRRRALAWFVLLPGFVNLHVLGQRLLGATLAAAATTWLFDRHRDEADPLKAASPGLALPAGIAFILGIGFHPSAAFVLVTTGALWLFMRRGEWTSLGLGIALPIAAYMAWLCAMGAAYPERRNNLLFYPLMDDFNRPFPAGMSVAEVFRSLSADDWWKLAGNRLRHLPHYVVPTNWSPAPWTWGRWISLPNVLCWGGVLLLVVRRSWRGSEAWCAWTVVAPLAFHHFFLGQADPQFHIGPAPFVALVLLLARTLVEPRQTRWWDGLLRTLIAGELAVRLLWPLVGLKLQLDRIEPTVFHFRLVGGDTALYFVLAALPAFVGWRVFRIAAGGAGGRSVRQEVSSGGIV